LPRTTTMSSSSTPSISPRASSSDGSRKSRSRRDFSFSSRAFRWLIWMLIWSQGAATLMQYPHYDWDFCVSTFGLFSISMWALRRMCQRKLFCIISLKLFILKSLLCDFIKRELQFCYVLVLLKILAMSRVVIIMAFLYWPYNTWPLFTHRIIYRLELWLA